MAIALIAWLMAPAPMACTSTFWELRITPAIAPATATGFEVAETLRISTRVPRTLRERLADVPGWERPGRRRVVRADSLKREHESQLRSFRVLDRAGLAEHGDLDLTGVGQLGLDALGDVPG